MKFALHTLKNSSRKVKKPRRIGRGVGCKKGKTCGYGEKGDKKRSGYTCRHGKEGGQQPLYMKLPTRGFTVGPFQRRLCSINLGTIEALFQDGETVNRETLHARGYTRSKLRYGVKILGTGDLRKRVRIEAHAISKGAMQKLEDAKIDLKIIKKPLDLG